MFSWISTHFPEILSLLAMSLSIGIGIANIFNASGLSTTFKQMQVAIVELQKGALAAKTTILTTQESLLLAKDVVVTTKETLNLTLLDTRKMLDSLNVTLTILNANLLALNARLQEKVKI